MPKRCAQSISAKRKSGDKKPTDCAQIWSEQNELTKAMKHKPSAYVCALIGYIGAIITLTIALWTQ